MYYMQHDSFPIVIYFQHLSQVEQIWGDGLQTERSINKAAIKIGTTINRSDGRVYKIVITAKVGLCSHNIFPSIYIITM